MNRRFVVVHERCDAVASLIEGSGCVIVMFFVFAFTSSSSFSVL
jgi:hypothetical protein